MKTKKRDVLIVDDSVAILDRLSTLLQDSVSVESIASAIDYPAAVDVLGERQFDIALLDIHLPGRNGIELLEFIKKNYPGTKVIMLTNQTGRHYRQLCEQLGAEYFVDKSKEFETLPGLIDGIPQ